MTNSRLNANETLIVRVAVGLVFGAALGFLIKQTGGNFDKAAVWQQVAISTLTLGAFIIWAGAGVMRRLYLIAWSTVALALIALIAWNRIGHGGDSELNPFFLNLGFLIYPFLFISHELISAADQSGKPIAPYALYFEEAWKRGVQLALSGLFTGLFWIILWLGAALLGFIGFHWLKDMLSDARFAFPLTGLALASAVNLGDVQPRLLENFRTLVLGILSWLLPVITLIGLLFAVSLCFSGLAPLWKTKAATASLLAACVALVLLINAAYQDGRADRTVHIILRWSARIACGLALVFSTLAAYSLYLRIGQYGLTPERVMALVGVVIALAYGLGYAVTALWPRGWLKPIAAVNITLAVVAAAICLVVLTPLADPYRLSAQSQMGRVNSGAVAPETFDWRALRFDMADYGRDALTKLAKSGKTATIRETAAKTLAQKDEDRYLPTVNLQKPLLSHLNLVYPSIGKIPESFLNQSFETNAGALPSCMTTEDANTEPCNVAVIDLNHDNVPEIVLQQGNRLYAFRYVTGVWSDMDINYGHSITESVQADFAKGNIKATPPKWDNLNVGNIRATVSDPGRDND